MTTNYTNKITLRTKFKEDLKEDTHLDLYAFLRFQQNEPERAIRMLWYMTYNDTYASSIFTIFGLDFENISKIKLRNEMRHQYNIAHPNFLKVILETEETKLAYEVLKDKTDLIVSYVIYQHCYSSISSEYEAARIIFLLKSDNENYFFGGLRSLGFNTDESNYLKPFHKEIGNLYEALHNEQKRNSTYLPFENINQVVVSTPNDYPEESHSKISKENNTVSVESLHTEEQSEKDISVNKLSFTPITVEEILKNKDNFSCIFKNDSLESLDSLRKTGFDLNQIIAKRTEISNLLSIVEHWSTEYS